MFTKIILYLFILGYLIFVLSLLGINLSGLVVAGGLLSIIIGLASQKVLGNVFSGIFLMIERPLKIGQSVKIEDESGFIEEIRFLSTIVRSFQGPLIRIPNERVFNSIITNYQENVARRIDYVIDIRYSDDPTLAITVIREFLGNHKFVLAIPEPEVFVQEFASSSVKIHIRFWCPAEKWYQTQNNLLLQVKEKLQENGIEIPFPQMEVTIKKPQC
ncbi:MAG: mechanosensitive ion channel family protein [Candidatus Kapaibacteriales bacterium]